MAFDSWANVSTSTNRPKTSGFDAWGSPKSNTSSDSSWSTSSTSQDNFFGGSEDWSTGSWRQNDSLLDHSGTKNPQNDPERIQRVEYLENELYGLRERVRDGDQTVDEAKRKLEELRAELSRTRASASEARASYNRLGNEVAGLKGKQAGNKMTIRDLRDRLSYTTDAWSIREIKAEIAEREGNRWPIADEISNKSDEYDRVKWKMHECEDKVRELEYTIQTAVNNVEEARVERRQRKEKLAEYSGELERLKSPF